ncbi:hypothetical protein AUEXF2481DRAFT_39042 [Aureobasidium subglaciale EXF-2481]|uniref:Uncharacterized protein n=1 Tax=Aureobasidium subglaciale (strain EXF-2481) TaxID=1043005 RepID=A0A074YDY8_AURSE|nr:uncharacterized protein AUEXF2481DRAFT_39042 [Aureobasidium subglaciale EXF-2481]KEQ95965.1 hypothetical protein AUEXF2481DRAFT_39042 [Aureobasidium subglaciale EXF-2481]
MIEPPWSLEGALEIDWTLSRPCIVSWTDINLETKTLGVEPQTVTLWFGVEPKSRVWIVLLRITLRFKISVRSIPFDFYIFVDPHSFQISKDPLAALSPELIDLPELHAAKSEHGWLSAIVQQQKHTQPAGLVLMKHQPPGNKPWSGTSLHLLSLVYSLSTAPEFKIYLGNESNVRRFVNRLNNELPRIIVPAHIDLQKAYRGRGGIWDDWNSYSDEIIGVQRADRLRFPDLPPDYSKTSTQPSQSRDFPPWSSLKRAADTQESESSLKKIVRLAQDSFPDCTPTEANTSIREGWSQQSAQVDMSSEQEQSTQSQSPRDNNHIRLTPGRLQTPEHKNPLPPYEDDETPPYIAHSSSPESLDRRCMKPTIFTRQYPIDASPKPTDLEVIVAATIQAQMPTIVAQVYNQIKLNETATLAQTTIDKHVAIHMPTMMQATLTAHLSDVNDEFESASGELQEVKDDAITEMRSARDDVLKELEEEIQVVHVEYRERVSELREEVFVDITDKMTEFEARIEAKTSVATPPAYGSVVPGTINRIKDAVKAFRDTYQVSLTSEQQVMVLLSFAQYSNAEVFMEADQESKRLLVAHWAGAERYVTNGVSVSLAGRG